MSIVKNYYVIAGYDLTGLKTEKFNNWRWAEDGEKYICYQSKGHIQLFDDPMDGSHLYLGYVLANGDEYEFNTVSVNPKNIEIYQNKVRSKLSELKDEGVIDFMFIPEFKLIIFEESS